MQTIGLKSGNCLESWSKIRSRFSQCYLFPAQHIDMKKRDLLLFGMVYYQNYLQKQVSFLGERGIKTQTCIDYAQETRQSVCGHAYQIDRHHLITLQNE